MTDNGGSEATWETVPCERCGTEGGCDCNEDQLRAFDVRWSNMQPLVFLLTLA